MSDISEKQEIDRLMQEIPRKIEEKTEELISARETYYLAKAEYQNQYESIVLKDKLCDVNLTQSDLKARAITGSHGKRCEMIRKQSTYNRIKKELQRLRDDFEATIERSYNYRAELRMLRG